MGKLVYWAATTRKDLGEASELVRRTMGNAIRAAQEGGKSDLARRMKGNLSDVIEVCETDAGGSHRLMYTVEIGECVYVLDFFQKKSTRGIATPKVDLNRIERRLKWAHAHRKALEKSRNNG